MEDDDYLSNLSLSSEAVEGDYLSTGARALGDYLSTLPHATEDEPLFDTCRSFTIDRGDYMHRVVVGKLYDEDGLVWVAGDTFPYRLIEQEGKTIVFLPPLVYKCTKEEAENMSPNQLKAKMTKESLVKLRADLAKAGCKIEGAYKSLDEWIDSDLSTAFEKIDELKEEHGMKPMDMLPLSLEELSTPNFCPICKCSQHRGKTSHIWSMEQINSSLDNCVAGNCECRGLEDP